MKFEFGNNGYAKFENGVLVKETRIIGTDTKVYEAWEPDDGGRTADSTLSLFGHSTITSIDGQWYGTIGSRRLPQAMDDFLPKRSQLRSDRVACWQQNQYNEAYTYIETAYPEAKNGRYSMGSIRM